MQRLFIFFLLFTLIACKTRKQVAPPVAIAIKQSAKDSVTTPEKKVPEVARKHKFKLTLLLTLNAQHYLEKDSVGNYVLSEVESLNLSALQFYEGLQAARGNNDSLISLKVIDFTADSLKLMKLFKDSMIAKSDMVVSIINPSMIPVVQKLAAEKHFPLMIPMSQTGFTTNGNPGSWLAVPSNKTQCRKMTDYLKDKNPSAVFTVIYRKDVKKEADLADIFNDELQSLFKDSINRKIDYSKADINILKKNLKPDRRNILIIPTSDQAFLSPLLIRLDKEEQYNFLVAGIPTWDRFESMDLSLLERLNTFIFNASYLDYENEKVKQFRKMFIENYHTDPLYSAYSGYDIYRWISDNVEKFGNETEKYKSSTSLTAPGSGFIFEKSCSNCGFENQTISILFFKEGALKKVK